MNLERLLLLGIIRCSEGELDHFFRITKNLCEKYSLNTGEIMLKYVDETIDFEGNHVDKSLLGNTIYSMIYRCVLKRFADENKIDFDTVLGGIADDLADIDLSNPDVKIDEKNVRKLDLSDKLYDAILKDIKEIFS